MISTIGAELEYHLVDKEGYLMNIAPSILSDPRGKEFCYESSNARIEINSSPCETIEEIHQDLEERIIRLEKICEEYGTMIVPTGSEYGAGSGTQKWTPRLEAYPLIIGEHSNRLIKTISAMHAHLSQQPGRVVDQFNLFTALDPVAYAITSTSPLSYEGKNSLNCHRINLVRNLAFNEFPLHSQLLDYVHSVEEIDGRDREKYQQWSNRWLMRSGKPIEIFSSLFNSQNTGFSPIRKRDNFGPTGTLEVRSFDIASLDILLAALALYKGTNDRMINENIEVSFGKDVKDRQEYSFSPKRIILPNYHTLKNFEEKTINSGIRSDDFFNYLTSILAFAEDGLPKEDKKYLDPLKLMLTERMNPADKIMAYLKSNGHYGPTYFPEQGALATLYLRNEHLKSLGRTTPFN
ncbi:MAG: glutamate-cysteine ligase family protein [Nanoarchaeota archaeon]|nr:hypothetical protein [Nanoarchaeota archaeon]MBU1632736.1 hypothetical protein [Nanoarchaeota archaeon]MBU1876652.1 hypothetical protein [Nanoarchaeota archaeon]